MAFVAQLSTMAPRLRADILARYPAQAQRSVDESDINAWLLGFSPETFGVTSYRHFVGEGAGSVFLRRLYRGEFRPLSRFRDYGN